MAAPSKPSIERRQSRVPGGFETDDDLSPIKSQFSFQGAELEDEVSRMQAQSLPQPAREEDSIITTLSEDGKNRMVGDDSSLEEKAMQRQLMELDSSFLPETSFAGRQSSSEMDDTFVFGMPHMESGEHAAQSQNGSESPKKTHSVPQYGDISRSSATPPDMYRTPALGRGNSAQSSGTDLTDGHNNDDSASETISSSPTAAAVARTMSRAASMASIGGYETANDVNSYNTDGNDDSTPPKPASPVSSKPASPTPTKPHSSQENSHGPSDEGENVEFNSPRSRKRPKFLKSRMSSQRSSYSSYTTTSTETGSDATLGADYALQSGGAAPVGGFTNRPGDLSRTTSLGSMASGISALSDEDRIRAYNVGQDGDLGTLEEEETSSITGTQTPKAKGKSLDTPTETLIAQRIRDIQVPPTLAREIRDRHQSSSPEKRNGAPTPSIGRHGKNLTLKEQSGTIDRLMKENFDLKLKVTFMDDLLNKRSEEGVKEIISENVEMRVGKVQAGKDAREFKRTIRELERKLKEKSDQLTENASILRAEKARAEPSQEEFQEIDIEITHLRDKVSTYEVEMERMAHDIAIREDEKRGMTELLKTVSERKGAGSDISAREEMDVCKDLLTVEAARRQYLDEENRKLRDDLLRFKYGNSFSTAANSHTSDAYRVIERHQMSSTVSRANTFDREFDRSTSVSGVSNTSVARLTHENADLRRDLVAQISMLTSRNREKERLYQEIEELKLGVRRGDGSCSVAGDSIFERSVSRAHGRSSSRISEFTKATQISENERELLEMKNGELRDQNSTLKLEVQALERQMDPLLDELDRYDMLRLDHDKLRLDYEKVSQEFEEAIQDLQRMQSERDVEIKSVEDLQVRIQNLKAEGQDRIDSLEEEVYQKDQIQQRLQADISNQAEQSAEQSAALDSEFRSLKERFLRVGEDLRGKVKRIEELEIEIEAITRETEAIDKVYHEEKDKNARLNVQQESSQDEISFLRDEQEAHVIKIGDLENVVNNLQNNLNSEKERTKDLDSRLAEERHQREVIGSKEKQDVQKMMNDLNREASNAKEESRKLKKSLHSSEIEATAVKERLMELESNLREALGDSNGTRSSFLTSITKLQKQLEGTLSELDETKNTLSEKDRLLKSRDALLESHGLESKKLSDLLERERQGRRADKAQHDQWQKTHQHTSRTVTQKDTRITELETSRQSDRKKIVALEQQFKDQLADRNNLLLTLWSRISTLCGSDWQHQNNLVNNHLPTLEVVSNMLPGFSKNLLLAVKTVEDMIEGFKTRVRTIDRDLSSKYQNIEQILEARIKKLDRLEATVQSQRVSGTFTAAPEIAKLRGENRLLKSELAVLQKQELHARASRSGSSSSHGGNRDSISERAAPAPTLMRHHSSSAVETFERANSSLGINHHNSSATASLIPRSSPIQPSEQRWIHRLRELERRLKAEREARWIDRSTARKRLEEENAKSDELRLELEREKERRKAAAASARSGSK